MTIEDLRDQTDTASETDDAAATHVAPPEATEPTVEPAPDVAADVAPGADVADEPVPDEPVSEPVDDPQLDASDARLAEDAPEDGEIPDVTAGAAPAEMDVPEPTQPAAVEVPEPAEPRAAEVEEGLRTEEAEHEEPEPLPEPAPQPEPVPEPPQQDPVPEPEPAPEPSPEDSPAAEAPAAEAPAEAPEAEAAAETSEEEAAPAAKAPKRKAAKKAKAAPAAEAAPEENGQQVDPFAGPGEWYVIHTYAGYENKVKTNLRTRIQSMQMQDKIFDVVIPMEDVMEIKGGKKQVVQKKVFPGYLLVKMVYDDQSWVCVRNTPGVTGFVSSGTGQKPTPLPRREAEKFLLAKQEETKKPAFRLEFEEGDVVRIISGPFADFNGTISDINVDQSKVRVMVNIFDRETPVELSFDQVARV